MILVIKRLPAQPEAAVTAKPTWPLTGLPEAVAVQSADGAAPGRCGASAGSAGASADFAGASADFAVIAGSLSVCPKLVTVLRCA